MNEESPLSEGEQSEMIQKIVEIAYCTPSFARSMLEKRNWSLQDTLEVLLRVAPGQSVEEPEEPQEPNSSERARTLREEQDLAFREAEEAQRRVEEIERERERREQEKRKELEREKERREQEERQEIKREKERLEQYWREMRKSYTAEPLEGLELRFRVPTEIGLTERRFSESTTVQQVLASLAVDLGTDLSQYELATCYPKAVLSNRNQSLAEAGIGTKTCLWVVRVRFT